MSQYQASIIRNDETKKEKKETYAERRAREQKEQGAIAADAKKQVDANAGANGAEPKRSNPFAKSVKKGSTAATAAGAGGGEGDATQVPPSPSKTNPFAKAKAPPAAAAAAEAPPSASGGGEVRKERGRVDGRGLRTGLKYHLLPSLRDARSSYPKRTRRPLLNRPCLTEKADTGRTITKSPTRRTLPTPSRM